MLRPRGLLYLCISKIYIWHYVSSLKIPLKAKKRIPGAPASPLCFWMWTSFANTFGRNKTQDITLQDLTNLYKHEFQYKQWSWNLRDRGNLAYFKPLHPRGKTSLIPGPRPPLPCVEALIHIIVFSSVVALSSLVLEKRLYPLLSLPPALLYSLIKKPGTC